ncbi:hypothetical protein KP13_04409 [Klebsiella pneumoniae subsp. pneumoniae Kp13]|nr:hypothetical protein KP13_04409 [Klebsiella pneumoniae subsp. pneumoniae Kp13]
MLLKSISGIDIEVWLQLLNIKLNTKACFLCNIVTKHICTINIPSSADSRSGGRGINIDLMRIMLSERDSSRQCEFLYCLQIVNLQLKV